MMDVESTLDTLAKHRISTRHWMRGGSCFLFPSSSITRSFSTEQFAKNSGDRNLMIFTSTTRVTPTCEMERVKRETGRTLARIYGAGDAELTESKARNKTRDGITRAMPTGIGGRVCSQNRCIYLMTDGKYADKY